jgi:hypothetical protein
MTGDAKYADVLERVVYNGLLSGVSLSGDKFFYDNPLGSKGSHHRVPWFDCSCCPTNIVRYLPGMGERAYAMRDRDVWTVMYMGGVASITLPDCKVKLTQETRYPWDGKVRITIEPEVITPFVLHLRIPSWCQGQWSVKVNGGSRQGLQVVQGYVAVENGWKPGDVVELDLPMPIQRVYADPHVMADVGRVALMRGPMVYCLEGADNDGQVRNVCLPRDRRLSKEFTFAFEPDLLGGVTVVRGAGERIARNEDGKLTETPFEFQAVPYCTWANRAPGQMVVWLPETPQRAELPGEDGVMSNGVLIRASHCFGNNTVTALNDQKLPKTSNDHSIPRMTWWDHKGTTEWVSYRYAKPQAVSSAAVYWFDDGPNGGCRVPAEWKLLWLDGKEWKPAKLTNGATYGTALDKFNEITFEPVTTRELKLEVKLKERFSGGILEWRVDASR